MSEIARKLTVAIERAEFWRSLEQSSKTRMRNYFADRKNHWNQVAIDLEKGKDFK